MRRRVRSNLLHPLSPDQLGRIERPLFPYPLLAISVILDRWREATGLARRLSGFGTQELPLRAGHVQYAALLTTTQ